VLFALRDDDVNFFTRPEQLERAYGAYWDRLPISLAIVPMHAATRSKAIPPEHWEGDREFPLADNGALVEYLGELFASGRASPMLHGYSHQNFPTGYEFQAGPDLPGRLRRGRHELERLFGRPIRTFVPPHNALSRRGIEALDRERLNVLGTFLSFRPSKKPWELATLMNYLKISLYRIRTRRSRKTRLIYPFPLRYKNHAEFGCHLLLPWTRADELIAGFEEARRFGGDFCLATHYWEIDDQMAAVLRRVVEHAERAGARFVVADRLFGPRPARGPGADRAAGAAVA
jgi:peptidoglycan/xylan/chitin deacetylase (PgdA/CDA1 family)